MPLKTTRQRYITMMIRGICNCIIHTRKWVEKKRERKKKRMYIYLIVHIFNHLIYMCVY